VLNIWTKRLYYQACASTSIIRTYPSLSHILTVQPVILNIGLPVVDNVRKLDATVDTFELGEGCALLYANIVSTNRVTNSMQCLANPLLQYLALSYHQF
jgi:hypothetical protein